MLSLWSAINPSIWLSPGDAEDGTFTLAELAPVNATTREFTSSPDMELRLTFHILALTPFWKTQTEFWVANEIESFTSLGYTYPEFEGLNLKDTQAVKTAISRKVATLYGPQSTPMNKNNKRSIDDGVGRRSALAERANFRPQLFTGRYSDWSARVIFQRSEIGHSFSIVFFFGDVPSDPQTWLMASNFVGAHHAFIHGMQCTSCDKDSFQEEGFVPLGPYIADQTTVSSFDSGLVVPFLTSQLQWRVLSVSGSCSCAVNGGTKHGDYC
jgi:tyrosinase